MSIRNYTPLGIAIWLLFCAAAHYSRIVPVPPIAIISFAALTGIAFQLENGKLNRMFHELLDALHGNRAHHAH